MDEVRDRFVLGVLNISPKEMDDVAFDVLVLGVQYPKAKSDEGTFVSPTVDAKIGSKLF